MCLYPKLIINRKYTPNKKNKGNPPKVTDKRTLMVPIGCGKCIECMNQKKREWQIRLHEHIKTNKNGKFVTLTFNEESIQELENELGSGEANSIATIAVRRFLERWRKQNKRSVPHWLITELGHKNTERLHLHGILFTNNEDIQRIWKYGEVYIGEYVNGKTINYIIKYITKIDTDHKGFQGKIFTSPGMGKNYTNRQDSKNNEYRENNTDQTYRLPNGTKINLPIYYRNKIYTDEERENLWIQLLEKKERYVRGEKIKINSTKGWKEYYRALKYAQKQNERMGYGNDLWKKEKYMASINIIDRNNLEI